MIADMTSEKFYGHGLLLDWDIVGAYFEHN